MNKTLLGLLAASTILFSFEFDLNNNNGPIKNLKILGSPESTITLSFESDEPITGADYDAEKQKFALCTLDNEFFITDENLKQLRYGKHDKHFIMEMEDTVGATWYKNEVAMISYNKTFVSYEPVDISDEKEQNSQWRHLIEGWDKWKLNDFANKNRFFTIRAKQQYILDFDYDKTSNKYVSASVPNDLRQYWAIGIFDGDDKMILEEYTPSVDLNLIELKESSDIAKYYITGIDVKEDTAYLLSKNYSTILKLNLKTKMIEDAFGFSGIKNPRALTIKDDKFYIFSREDDENKVFVFNMM